MWRRLPALGNVPRPRVGLALAVVVGVLATLLSTPAAAGSPAPRGSSGVPASTPRTTPDRSLDAAAVQSPATTRAWRRGECRNGRGVTVVVDFRSLGRGKIVRCVQRRIGRGFSGLDALQAAGIRVRGVDGFGKSFVCRLQGRPRPREDVKPGPGTYREKCRRIPPKSAYWSYWYARDGGRWRYSKTGAGGRNVIRGGFEGWSFHAGRGDAKPPRRKPNRPGRVADPASFGSVSRAGGVSTVSAVAASAGAAAPHRLTPSRHSSGDASTRAARRAAEWLLDDLRSGRLPGPGGRTDWGLTLDAFLASRAAGVASAEAAEILAALAGELDAYLGPAIYADPRARIAGATAKTLVALAVDGRPTTRMSGYDLRSELLGLMQKPGDRHPGRFSDQRTGADSSNTVSQALAVIGLARSGDVPQPALTYLRRQQCPAGWFRMYGDQGRTCADGQGAASAPDADGTAMALQALLAARATGASAFQSSIRRATAWLVGQQAADGSFGGGELTAGANANSTGLAAQALDASGRPAAAARANRWLRSVQILGPRTADTQAAADTGAVAYDAGALRGARSGGIEPLARDQWRRATAQAVLGLAGTSFADLGGHPVEADPTTTAAASPSEDATGGTGWPRLLLGGLAALVAAGAATAALVRWTRRRPGLPA
ncbi:MAG: hypothetical protein K0Q93_1546 [Nocardioidaceae bacterium]|jgi:hypothetical protein|nr:hypothetical protein [Nocardioidaceae bacterium]